MLGGGFCHAPAPERVLGEGLGGACLARNLPAQTRHLGDKAASNHPHYMCPHLPAHLPLPTLCRPAGPHLAQHHWNRGGGVGPGSLPPRLQAAPLSLLF